MFLSRKNRYCENDYTTKYNLQIQWDPYQITNSIFHRTRKKNFTIHMETQKTPNSQSSLENEEWNLRNQPSWLQNILQSYSHQDSMVLAQKQKYRLMEQDWKPINKPMHLWVPYFWQRRTLHSDQRINPRRRYNNYKYICTQHRSTAICKTNANKYERGN